VTIPAAWTQIEVFGDYLDIFGLPAKGRILFRNRQIVRVGSVVVMPGVIAGTLDEDGHLSVLIPSTDDPDISPGGWTWEVQELIPRGRPKFSITVPHNGGPINLVTALPVTAVDPLPAYLDAPADGQLWGRRNGAWDVLEGGEGGASAWGDITGTLSAQTDLATALNLKAPLASPTFTGVPAAPTATGGTSTTQVATTAFVGSAVSTHAGAAGAHPISGVDGLAAALALLAPLASPALTGTPTAPTASGGTANTQLATTAFVASAIAALLGSVPGALDTLDELAAALGDDPNFATTVTNALAGKAAKASNLADLTDANAALTNLGGTTIGAGVFKAANALAIRTLLELGAAALLNVGTGAGTVAAGDDSRIVGAVQTSRTLTAAGLVSGGGDLSANRTLTVSAAVASDVDTGTATNVAMTPDSYRDSTPYYVDRTADWTLAQADANTEQQFNSGSARVCTIDTNANVTISVGTVVPLVRIGSGSATIDAVAGVTLNGVDGASKVISTQYQGALLRKVGTNAWILSGDIA